VAIQGAILQEFCALYTKLPQWWIPSVTQLIP
jgi:hypothetical protein